MNKVFTGGLGSYALSCTVIGYFNVGYNYSQVMYIVFPVLTEETDTKTHKTTKGDSRTVQQVAR